MEYALTTGSENVSKMREWIAKRGGIAVWAGINLSNIRQLLTPANTEEGLPYPKPAWDMSNAPEKIVTDPTAVGVSVDKEAKRFHVAVRRSSNGMSVKLTDASSRKVRAAVEKAGDGSYYIFDYETQEAVIMKSEKVIPLTEYKECV